MQNFIRIADVKYIRNHIFEIVFDDGCIKQFDFAKLFDFKGIQGFFRDIGYFTRAKIADDRRRLYWDNEYDCCADWLRYFAKDVVDEWAGLDDAIDLQQRMKMAKQNMLRLE